MMKLVFPNITYKEKAMEFIEEFYTYDSEIHGSGALERFLKDSTYEAWLEKVLAEAVKVCETIGIEEVIVTCDKSNIASAKVITNCGGELDAEFYSETFGEVIQRYKIV